MKYVCIVVLLSLMGCQSKPVSLKGPSGYSGMEGLENCTFEGVEIYCDPINEG